MSERIEVMPLSFVRERHFVRPINQRYVEQLTQKIGEVGPKPYPLSVTPGGVLFGGHHRYEAFQKLGLTEVWIHVSTPGSLDREAIELNRASEDALPMSFVDYAELVWRKLNGGGATQQAVADELGWSKQQAHQYANLQKLSEDAWRVVSTTVRETGGQPTSGEVDGKSTAVDFSERLLREIVPLLPAQQLELVQRLARGKDTKGHKFGKGEFKTAAERYRAYNALCEAAREALAERMPEERAKADLAYAAEELEQSLYIEEFQASGKPGKRFADLIQSYVDEYEEALNSKVIVADMRELTAEQIPDGSIDAIVTDPPYPREFVGLFDDLGTLAARVLKPGGSLVVLCGQSYLPEYIDLLQRHLDYVWPICVDMPGGQAVQLHQREVITFWKPALWFTNGPRDGKWVSDVIRTDVNNNDKAHHEWGQSEQIMKGLVERVSLAGETVLDPFLGGGTTGVVCRKLKRKFVGVEVDEKIAAAASRRIAEAPDA